MMLRMLITTGMIMGVFSALAGGVGASEAKESGGNQAPLDSKRYESPILLTSIGQSSDVRIAKILFTVKAKVPASMEMRPDPNSLTGYKTVVVVVGGSGKGLGAAGIDLPEEVARAQRLMKKLAEAKIPVVVLHTGGKERRGELSDPFIEAVLPYADSIIVKVGGNEDGLFTRAAKERKVILKEVESLNEDLVPLIKEWFSPSS